VSRRVRVARLAAAVESISQGSGEDRALRAAVLDVLERFVPFDAYAFLLTDPVTTVGCSPVADVPGLTTLPNLIRLKYLTGVNRWSQLPASGCATLQAATRGHPEESLVWREHLAELGILDVLSVVFTDRFGCWGFLDLWRRGNRFTDEEMTALADARAAITARLRRVQAAAFTAAGGSRPDHRPGALVLSSTLEVRTQTPQTRDWLATLVPPQSGRMAVPASAYNVAAQLLANEAGVDAHPPRARVHLGGGTWLTLRADRLSGGEPAGEHDIAVTMEASSPEERREVFSRCHGLTQREDEVLRHLAEGVDTRTVARVMSISELTVQDYLKSVFTKTATSSRRELIAMSLGR
jgi:DNA-binding CsgD family transcriptional regulator